LNRIVYYEVAHFIIGILESYAHMSPSAVPYEGFGHIVGEVMQRFGLTPEAAEGYVRETWDSFVHRRNTLIEVTPLEHEEIDRPTDDPYFTCTLSRNGQSYVTYSIAGFFSSYQRPASVANRRTINRNQVSRLSHVRTSYVQESYQFYDKTTHTCVCTISCNAPSGSCHWDENTVNIEVTVGVDRWSETWLIFY
jgi:hypothetical protein